MPGVTTNLVFTPSQCPLLSNDKYSFTFVINLHFYSVFPPNCNSYSCLSNNNSTDAQANGVRGIKDSYFWMREWNGAFDGQIRHLTSDIPLQRIQLAATAVRKFPCSNKDGCSDRAKGQSPAWHWTWWDPHEICQGEFILTCSRLLVVKLHLKNK